MGYNIQLIKVSCIFHKNILTQKMQQKQKFMKCIQLNITSKYKSETNQIQPKSLYTRKLNYISQTDEAHIKKKHSKAKSQYFQKNKFVKKSKRIPYMNLCQIQNENGSKTKHNLKKQDLRDFIVIGVFQQKIAVCYNNNLRMFGYFDQHAMHERIRYQFYIDQVKLQNQEFGFIKKRNWNINIIEKEGKTPKQVIGKKIACYSKIFFQQNQVFLRQKDEFTIQFLGFKILAQQKLFSLLQYPLIFNKNYVIQVYIQIAKQIIQNYKEKNIQIPKKMDDVIAQSSCKSAYKFNDKISNSILSQMICSLSNCDYSFYCVHGRPTFFIK